MYTVIKNLWRSLHLRQSDYHFHTDSDSGVTLWLECFFSLFQVYGEGDW